MPSRKSKEPGATASAQPAVQTSAEPIAFFPFARYTGIVGVHTSLLTFAALFLPSTSLYSIISPWTPTPEGEKRNPMRALTENPLQTVAWICAGALLLQGWWASWVRAWYVDARERKKDSTEELQHRLQRQGWNMQRFQARSTSSDESMQPREEYSRNTLCEQVHGQAAAMTLAASVLFYVLTVLFGAPLFRCVLGICALYCPRGR